MAPPHQYSKYGSVDNSELPTSRSSLLPRWSRCRTSSHPAEGEHHPSKRVHLRDLEVGRSVSWRLVVAGLFGFTFLAICSVPWSRRTASRSTAATLVLLEVGADASGIAALDIRPKHDPYGGASADLEFTALNFYHVRDGKPAADYPWLKDVKLIEPHRETTLSVVGPRDGFDYRWEVRAGSGSGSGEVGEVQATTTGAVTIVVFTQLDDNVVVLEEVDRDGRVANRLEETVMVKYVRREIRTLTNDEREELLDAVSGRISKPAG